MKYYKPLSTFRDLKAAVSQLEASGTVAPDTPLVIGGELGCLFTEHGEHAIKLDSTSILNDIAPSRSML